MTLTQIPRFNHVAMSLPADTLDESSRADIVRFYHDVFGWDELPTMTIDRQRLVLSAGRVDQFVFLIADDHPMAAPRLDHWGMRVATLDDLHELLSRTKAFAEHDDRVDIVDYDVDDQEVVKIHAFYVGYLLPMMVEVQYWEWPSGDPFADD